MDGKSGEKLVPFPLLTRAKLGQRVRNWGGGRRLPRTRLHNLMRRGRGSSSSPLGWINTSCSHNLAASLFFFFLKENGEWVLEVKMVKNGEGLNRSGRREMK